MSLRNSIASTMRKSGDRRVKSLKAVVESLLAACRGGEGRVLECISKAVQCNLLHHTSQGTSVISYHIPSLSHDVVRPVIVTDDDLSVGGIAARRDESAAIAGSLVRGG